MKNKNLLVPIAIVAAGAIIGGAVILSQKDPYSEDVDEGYQEPVVEEPQFEQIVENIEIEGWPFLGEPDAPIVIVEYSDFACPFCKRFYEETLPLIKQNHIETGQVRFVYKDFIVVGGDRAAEAAHCAGEQEKYWEYHDLLFENLEQDRANWSDSQVHRGYAQQLGLDADALIDCFEERRFQSKVAASTQEAQRLGGTGTPYFIIGNESVSGAQPYQVFEEIINQAF